MKIRLNNPAISVVEKNFLHCVIACLSLLHSVCISNISQADSAYVDNFLSHITKDWRGTAVETPVGPVNYDISFIDAFNGHVTGSADLDRSTHYWDFYP